MGVFLATIFKVVRKPGWADGISSFVGLAAGTAAHFHPEIQPMIAPYLWQVPLWGLGAAIVWRLIAAPFHIAVEANKRAEIAELKVQTDAAEERRHRERMESERKTRRVHLRSDFDRANGMPGLTMLQSDDD